MEAMLVTFFTVGFVTVYDSYVMLLYTLLLLLDKVPKYMLFINWGFFFFPQGCEKSMRFVLQTDHYGRGSSAMKLICLSLTLPLTLPHNFRGQTLRISHKKV